MRHRRPAPAPRHRARPPEERSLIARFVGSFPRADAALDPPLPEVALVGRSNVGKSSLLNGVAGRRIAKVSATPGKTRAMNVYLIPDGALVGAQHAAPLRHAPCYFLDLPGYGYAKASKAERSGFRGLLAHILDRANIVGVVWLLDVRREPSAEDLAMQDLLAARGTRVLAAITKSDKLPRGQRERAAHALRETLALDADQLIVTSARTGEGVVELRETIASLLRSPSA